MGMFDSVYADCPRCGRQVEFQSKAGECTLKRYRVSNVPAAIADDINGETMECACGFVLKLVTPAAALRVRMGVVDAGADTDAWD